MATESGESSREDVKVKPTCFGLFDEEYTMDSDCPRCLEHNNCKEVTNENQ